MSYIPHSAAEVRSMLDRIGLPTVEDLFATIPRELRLARPLELPPPLAEADLLHELAGLAARNATSASHLSFLGGGAYDHFIPAVVDHLASRSEFYTAYTPYQPEISQGTLQAIFEFQTLICQLTGMDVANASMYDGASSCAEGVLLAVRQTRRRKVLLSAGLHPEYRETVITYCRYLNLEIESIPLDRTGRTDQSALEKQLDSGTAAVVVGYPNFFGVIEDLAEISEAVHRSGAYLVGSVAEAMSLGLLQAPGALGVDVVTGEGQSFGLPLAYGGPYVGFFAVRQRDVRAMPGRLVGETTDRHGQRGFVLTLATREQHIRREKATSNICSNHGLCALMATVYLALLGKEGLREAARQNLAKAEYAKARIAKLDGFVIPFTAPTFNEFVVEAAEGAEAVLARLERQGILGGIPLGRFDGGMANRFLLCVTEKHRRQDIDTLIEALAGRGE